MQTAFFLDDEFQGRVSIASISTFGGNSNSHPNNVSDPRPRVEWVAGTANPASVTDTRFEVDNNNRYIDVTGASGAATLTIPRGPYNGQELSDAITQEFAASTYTGWSCSYDLATARFIFSGSPSLDFLWKTGPNGSDSDDKSLVRELGFVNPGGTVADSGSGVLLGSPFPRWNTHTWVLFKMSEIKNLRAWMCEVGTHQFGEPDPTIDDSYVKIYGHATGLGDLWQWQSNASNDFTYSPAAVLRENQIRLAYKASGAASTAIVWLFSWRHQDSKQTHSVKLCKAFERTWSDTGRTVTTLRRHGLLNTGQSLGIDNYYPVQRLRRWVAPLAFDSWPASEYRTVIQGVVHHGRQNGLMWALRWDDIVDGTVDAEDEANDGFLLWATLQDYSRDTYVGASAAIISGDSEIAQLR